MTVLPPAWYARPAEVIGPALIGQTLARRLPNGEIVRGLIVETEAYTQDDPACHGYGGRITPARQALFGPPGHAYVYFTYGMHHCCNVVTDRDGFASAALLRAVALTALPPGVVLPAGSKPERLAAGPGKLCRVLGIDRSLNGAPLTPATGLWVEAGPLSAPPLAQTPRIGITRGTEFLWRWCLAGHPAVSRPARPGL
jgi:DNA-3-methyladenine glycosylase